MPSFPPGHLWSRFVGCLKVLPLVTNGISIMNRMHRSVRVRPAPLTDTCPLVHSPKFTRFNQWPCWKSREKYDKKKRKNASTACIEPLEKKPSKQILKGMSIVKCQPNRPTHLRQHQQACKQEYCNIHSGLRHEWIALREHSTRPQIQHRAVVPGGRWGAYARDFS
ncbi:hypothetical protein J3F83DRAFT_652628 [Trichoderma novae-zelandiae]